MNRDKKLATQLVEYSTKAKAGDTVYIEVKGFEALNLGKELIAKVTEIGATPFWYFNDESLFKNFLKNASEEQIIKQQELHLHLMQKSDCYIGVRGSDNPFDLSDISQEKRDLYSKLFLTPVHFKERVNNTRWTVLRYPNSSMAQLAEMSTESFKDFYYDVCLANYKAMDKAQEPLKKLMEATDKVRLTAKDTDLTFSIKDIPKIKCAGTYNIPDGEVFTAPVRDSVNGYITYNTPLLYQGTVFNNVRLEFKDGKIIKATSNNDQKKLNAIFDTDEGARYVGEFAIGVNPFILNPMKDILFDEKIYGSIHFTPGSCYDDASNGNKSAIHWDMVLIQREDYGGGEIFFDDKLIRKNGIFVDKDMEAGFSKENLSFK
jgi:aminopeptidase